MLRRLWSTDLGRAKYLLYAFAVVAAVLFGWTAKQSYRVHQLTRGVGDTWFHTADGAKWLDLGALAYQVNVGHGHRRIIEAIKRQADEMCVAAPTSVLVALTGSTPMALPSVATMNENSPICASATDTDSAVLSG